MLSIHSLDIRKTKLDITLPYFCRYATASARSDGMFLLCGGRDSAGAVRSIFTEELLSILLVACNLDGYLFHLALVLEVFT